MQLSHLDEKGNARMVNIGEKQSPSVWPWRRRKLGCSPKRWL